MKFRLDPTAPMGVSVASEPSTTVIQRGAVAGQVAPGVQSVVAGTNVTVDNTDPRNPIVSASGGGSGGGATNLSTTSSATTVTVASDTGTDATLTASTGTSAGIMTAADRTKLDGIATGATANSSDATLLNRANHTGTQASTTISDFDTAVDARIATVVDAAPASLDTLNELAAALGDDANFASTVTTSLAGKANTVHTHAIADVTDLQTELDAKGDVTGPASAEDNHIVVFDSTTGKVVKNSRAAVTPEGILRLKPDLIGNPVIDLLNPDDTSFLQGVSGTNIYLDNSSPAYFNVQGVMAAPVHVYDELSDPSPSGWVYAGATTVYQDSASHKLVAHINGASAENIATEGYADAAAAGKLDSVVAGTNVTIDNTDPNNPVISASGGGGGGATNLAATLSATNTIITSDTGTDATIPAVDGTNAGVMTPAQKTKLDGIATGATANTGDVVGPASSVANTLAIYSSTTGKALSTTALSYGANLGWASLGSGGSSELRLETNNGANDQEVKANGVPVVTTTKTQTLTNKTLTAPVLGGTVTGTYTLGGTPTFPSTVVSTTGAQTITNKTISTGSVIDSNVTVTEVLKKVYPIGSVYMATVSTNPATLFGFGTWAAYGEGRVVVGKAASGTFATAGATGGAETVVLSASEIPAHTHPMATANVGGGGGGGTILGGSGTTNTGSNTGGGSAHNNLQPYIVAYMWQRTA